MKISISEDDSNKRLLNISMPREWAITTLLWLQTHSPEFYGPRALRDALEWYIRRI